MSKSQQVEEQGKVLRWIAEQPEEVEMLTNRLRQEDMTKADLERLIISLQNRGLDYLLPIYLYLAHDTGMIGYSLERLLFEGFPAVVEEEGVDAVLDEIMQRAEGYHKAMTGEEGAEGKTDAKATNRTDKILHTAENRA